MILKRSRAQRIISSSPLEAVWQFLAVRSSFCFCIFFQPLFSRIHFFTSRLLVSFSLVWFAVSKLQAPAFRMMSTFWTILSFPTHSQLVSHCLYLFFINRFVSFVVDYVTLRRNNTSCSSTTPESFRRSDSSSAAWPLRVLRIACQAFSCIWSEFFHEPDHRIITIPSSSVPETTYFDIRQLYFACFE